MNKIYDFTTLTLVLFLFYMRDSVTDKHHLKLYVLFSCKMEQNFLTHHSIVSQVVGLCALTKTRSYEQNSKVHFLLTYM